MSDNHAMMSQIRFKNGFFAALDQSGGSTPSALLNYGISKTAYTSDEEMFQLVHAMRVRIATSPAFSSDRIIGAILFDRTMDGDIDGLPAPTFLWQRRGIVPFLKIDRGLEAEEDGVRLMKPIDGVDALLDRARLLGIFGTKMRSVIAMPSRKGIAAIIRQQFELAERIADHGLLPILEPEVLLASPQKAEIEALLLDEIKRALDSAPVNIEIMLKLSLPEEPNHYAALASDSRVVRTLALSGGLSQIIACARLSQNQNVIASFSRALLENLRRDMTDADFNRTLESSIEHIFAASTKKAS